MSAPERAIAAEHILLDIGGEPVWGRGQIALSGGIVSSVTATASGKGRLAMPALVNAHDHGRGLSTALAGAPDGPLELWLASLAAMPQIDPYAGAAFCFARMARAGIGATNVTYDPNRPEALADEARAVACAARDVGIRVSLCLPVVDRNLAGYGDAGVIGAWHEPADWASLAPGKLPGVAEQIALVDAIAAEIDDDLVNVRYHAIGPIWLSRAGLEQVADAVRQRGRGVYMHLLETRRQRAYLDAEYDGRLIETLDAIGLLGPHLGVAHAVWLRPDEIACFAERGVTVSVNTASNLRLRSGLAPVAAFITAGLRFGIGLDSMAFADSADLLSLARLTHLLHAGTGLDDAVSFESCLRAVLRDGYGIWKPEELPLRGRIAAGTPADIAVLDLNRLAPDTVGDLPPMAILAQRGSGAAVTDLFVAGRQVVADGRVIGVDEAALAEAVIRDARRNDVRPVDRATASRHRAAMKRYYAADAYLLPAAPRAASKSPSLALRGGRLGDGRSVDILIENGRIARIGEPGTRFEPAAEHFDLAGGLILPSFIDGHVHLDKTLLGAGWVGNTAAMDVEVMVGYERSVDAQADRPIRARAGALIERASRSGTGWFRSHIDIDPGVRLSRLEAVLEALADHRDRIDAQLVAFPQQGVLSRPGTLELLGEALASGATVLGGMDPSDIDGDIDGQLDALFALAEVRGVPLDLHLHNMTATGLAELDGIAERTIAAGMVGRVVVSHALSLGAMPWQDVAPTAARLGRAGISVMTCVPGNAPIPPAKALAELGVTVFAASDNIRDAWSPFGDADMLRRATLLAWRQDWNADADFAFALERVTSAAAHALGIEGYGLAEGNVADLVVVPAPSVREAVADPRLPALVLKRGRVVHENFQQAGGKTR